jgi:Fe-S cluster biogenesis protein NfuA
MKPVEFEQTPNPHALRILPGRPVSHGAVRQFTRSVAVDEPLAAALLKIDGVVRVMIGPDFLTVVREDARWEWDALRPEIVLAIADAPECSPETPSGLPQAPCPERGEIEQQIEDVLDRWVRPMLAADGGDAILVRFDAAEGTAWVRMEGACGGCPSGSITLKRGIEQSIRRWVPEVTRVLAAETESQRGADPKARFRDWIARKWGSG